MPLRVELYDEDAQTAYMFLSHLSGDEVVVSANVVNFFQSFGKEPTEIKFDKIT
ncbi:hypothetical protein [Psychrobacter sp. GW64-MNA-CIBAN-0177]|uniref:hypothetical protein n=1 Tax=Psychrobacter sp. GW64-MNA-CIBAN-0177 TaxID=3140449 RepID=UPI00331C2443